MLQRLEEALCFHYEKMFDTNKNASKKKRLFGFFLGVPLYLRPNMTKLFTITNIQLASGFRCFSNPYLIGFQKPPKKTTQPAAIVVPNAKLEELKLNKPHWDARYLSKDAEEVPKAPVVLLWSWSLGVVLIQATWFLFGWFCRVGSVKWLKASNIYQQTEGVHFSLGLSDARMKIWTRPAQYHEMLIKW